MPVEVQFVDRRAGDFAEQREKGSNRDHDPMIQEKFLSFDVLLLLAILGNRQSLIFKQGL